MADRSFLSWPFFEAKHRDFAARLSAFGKAKIEPLAHDEHDADATTKNFVSMLAAEKFLDAAVPEGSHDVRTLCLARETLAYHSGLVDFAFAMQGLGTGSIVLFGSPEQKAKWLPAVRAGKSLGAFAMSEPEGGSDVAALRTTATKDGDFWRLNGRKTWISNGGIAGQYVVFARTGEATGAKGLSAFVVPADAPGLIVEARIDVSAPHPLATLRFDNCRVEPSALLGKQGDGFKIAMSTLDVFRSTVGAAALGFARRALDEAIAFSKSRKVFGAMLSDMQLTQAALAEAATEIDAAALLIYRAAWTKDTGAPRITREASMAKFFATEMAQRVVDRAVQLHGGQGVVAGATVERLYREVRALRIYEGASEIQKLVIASQILSEPQT